MRVASLLRSFFILNLTSFLIPFVSQSAFRLNEEETQEEEKEWREKNWIKSQVAAKRKEELQLNKGITRTSAGSRSIHKKTKEQRERERRNFLLWWFISSTFLSNETLYQLTWTQIDLITGYLFDSIAHLFTQQQNLSPLFLCRYQHPNQITHTQSSVSLTLFSSLLKLFCATFYRKRKRGEREKEEEAIYE